MQYVHMHDLNWHNTMNMTCPFSISTFGLEILVAVSVFVAIHSLRQKRRHGLPVWPLLGMLPSLALALRGNLYEWLTEVLRRRNGTFRFRGPAFSSLNCVVTADPRNVEHLLKTKFGRFPKGDYFRTTLRDLLGDGIFNADGDTWQRQRKAASLEFHSARFRQLTTHSLVDLVHSRLLPVLQDSLTKQPSIDLQDVLLRLTFDNVCMIALGVDPGCLRPGLPEIGFARAFEEATEGSVLRFVMPTWVWRGMRWLNVGPERRLRESMKVVDEFAQGVIRRRKREVLSGAKEEPWPSDVLTAFMRMRGDNGEPYYSDKLLRDICINFILAGRDTSSVALAWFFWLLDAHPAVEERILEEIQSIADGRVLGQVVFTAEEVRRMDYLHAAISEALRLYPSVPLDHKEVEEDEVFPDGTELKKGTKVIYAMYAMGRMESIWGPDCRDYKPERWLDGRRRFVSESAYKFSAFNGGPRLCLGKDFAYFQMKFVAASILSCYRLCLLPTPRPTSPRLALTMYISHGLRVHLTARPPHSQTIATSSN